jgi:hypothetical protein
MKQCVFSITYAAHPPARNMYCYTDARGNSQYKRGNVRYERYTSDDLGRVR